MLESLNSDFIILIDFYKNQYIYLPFTLFPMGGTEESASETNPAGVRARALTPAPFFVGFSSHIERPIMGWMWTHKFILL